MPKKVPPDVSAAFDGILLEFAVERGVHNVQQRAFGIFGQQRVPAAAPDDLDDIPPGAPEDGFQFLNDFAVAAYGAVEPLQVAVDDKHKVVEALTRRQMQRAERLRLIRLAIAQKGPHPRPGSIGNSTVVQIAVEARLIDGIDGSQPHGNRRKFPEIRHQPWMGVARKPFAQRLPAEVFEMFDRQASFQKGAGVNARRGVPLVENLIAGAFAILALKEMIEPDFVQAG